MIHDFLQQPIHFRAAHILMGHLAAAMEDHGLHLEAVTEKANDLVLAHLKVVLGGGRPKLHFLDVRAFLVLLLFVGFLVLLVEEFSVIDELAYGRNRIGRDFHHIETSFARRLHGVEQGHHAELIPRIVNHANFTSTNALVYSKTTTRTTPRSAINPPPGTSDPQSSLPFFRPLPHEQSARREQGRKYSTAVLGAGNRAFTINLLCAGPKASRAVDGSAGLFAKYAKGIVAASQGIPARIQISKKAYFLPTMKAIQVQKVGGPEVLSYVDLDVPKPAANQAIVQIKAAGINFIDVYFREGRYPTQPPFVDGQEGSGVVSEVGADVKGVKVGDRVAYTGVLGSYAEYAAVPADRLVKLPEKLDFKQGAAAMLQGTTAHYLSHTTYPLKPGDIALVHSAAGGVGLLLVQMAKKLGARVIGTVSTEEKA